MANLNGTERGERARQWAAGAARGLRDGWNRFAQSETGQRVLEVLEQQTQEFLAAHAPEIEELRSELNEMGVDAVLATTDAMIKVMGIRAKLPPLSGDESFGLNFLLAGKLMEPAAANLPTPRGPRREENVVDSQPARRDSFSAAFQPDKLQDALRSRGLSLTDAQIVALGNLANDLWGKVKQFPTAGQPHFEDLAEAFRNNDKLGATRDAVILLGILFMHQKDLQHIAESHRDVILQARTRILPRPSRTRNS